MAMLFGTIIELNGARGARRRVLFVFHGRFTYEHAACCLAMIVDLFSILFTSRLEKVSNQVPVYTTYINNH